MLNYGEVDQTHVLVTKGESVRAGQHIGIINKSVLKSNKGRPMVMLHLEMMDHGHYDFLWWDLDKPQPQGLRDPTSLLRSIVSANGGVVSTFDITKFDGKKFIDPSAPRKDSIWWSQWAMMSEPPMDPPQCTHKK